MPVIRYILVIVTIITLNTVKAADSIELANCMNEIISESLTTEDVYELDESEARELCSYTIKK